MKSNRYTVIDLFCGCGGFSLGLRQSGFELVAALDFNNEAIQVYKKNFPEVQNARVADLTTFAPEELQRSMGCPEVDLIVGGPPCQGFSTVRQVDGANSGPRLVEDDRRYLYRRFLDFVAVFRPKVFIMENVLGIKTTANGIYFERVQHEARAIGYRVHPQVEKAVEYGVPQKRVRQLIIGTRLDMPMFVPFFLRPLISTGGTTTLGEAIVDLPPLKAGEGTEVADYDLKRRDRHLMKFGPNFLHDVLEVDKASKLTAHRARPHSARDLRDFAKLKEGENSAQAIRRGVDFEFPYDRSSFKDRYTRQDRKKPCSTIVAHLSKDGLMFIHPTQNRSLTPREAARVQTFPDTFEFPVARTHQFRVIGNAVPPLLAKTIGRGIHHYLTNAGTRAKSSRLQLLPTSQEEAATHLETMLDLGNGELRKLPLLEFKKLWFSVGFLFSKLHPDSALDHGLELCASVIPYTFLDERLQVPFYVRSGWPVGLAPLANEAWSRYLAKQLKDEEFYCSDAVHAGTMYPVSSKSNQCQILNF